MKESREFDVVVWGATGFTGKWVAKHLFDNYPQEKLTWTIAGRNSEKLDSVKEFVGDQGNTLKYLVADSDDEKSLRAMVSRTKVIISTVGPYAYYGSLLVKVCAELGTDYVDLTGEVPWIREMIDSHSDQAQISGARIVHCCGFDSIPSDMGVYYSQQEAQKKHKAYLKNSRFALLKMKGGVSGGTIHSSLNVIEQAVKDKKVRRLMVNPYSLNPDPKYKGPDKADQRTSAYSKELGQWTAPFVMAGINTRIVRRSNALMGFKYGEDFSYTETMVTDVGFKGRFTAFNISAGFGFFALTAATGLGRKLLSKLLPAQGEGPEVDPDNPGFYLIDFRGETAQGKKLHVQVAGDGDPGYGSTSKMLAESAVCLALDGDQIDVAGGFWTPSSAMGQPLLARLQKNAGLSFEVMD